MLLFCEALHELLSVAFRPEVRALLVKQAREELLLGRRLVLVVASGDLLQDCLEPSSAGLVLLDLSFGLYNLCVKA